MQNEQAFFMQLFLHKQGQFELRYSSTGRIWIRLFVITADQADWMNADGWKIVKED